MTEGPGAGAGRIIVGVDGSQPSQQVLVIHGDQAPPA